MNRERRRGIEAVLIASVAFWEHPAWIEDVELAIELRKPVVIVKIAGAPIPEAFERRRARCASVTVCGASGPAAAAIRKAIDAEPGEVIDGAGRRAARPRPVQLTGGGVIRITVELLPHGREDNKRVLGIGEIANDGTGTAALGNYVATFSKWAPQTGEIWRAAHLVGFDRKDRGPWDLLLACLIAALHDRRMGATQGKTISPGVAKKLLARPPLLGRDAPHTFAGRLDRDCELCGRADRHPIHQTASTPEAT